MAKKIKTNNAPITEDPTSTVVDQGQKLSQSEEQQFVLTRYMRFLRARNYRTDMDAVWKVIDQFDRGDQWKNVSTPPWVPKPVTNWMRFVRTLKRANLASAISKANFTPVHPEDQETIDMLQQAYNFVWETEKVPRTIRRSIDRALNQGTSIVQVFNDDTYVGGKYYAPSDDPRAYNPVTGQYMNKLYKGKIGVKRFPIGNFFPDPDAYRLEDCKFIETTEIMPLTTVKNNPQFQKYAGDKLAFYKSNELEYDSSASGTIYERDHDPLNTSTSNLHGDELVTVHTHWERYMDKNGQWHLDVSYYIRNSDFLLLRLTDVAPNEYPFAVLYDEEEENQFWGRSTEMDILENQKIINKVDQTASVIAVLNQNPQKVVSRTSGINAQELARTSSMPGKVYVSNDDPSRSIHQLEPPDIPKALFDMKDRKENDIRNIVGINEAYTGNSVGSLTTSSGVNDLIERATVRDKDKMIQIDEFVERISHLIVLFIVHTWDTERPIGTPNPDGSLNDQQYKPLTQLQANNLEWMVRSNVYASAPTTQATRRQQVTQLLQWQGQYNFSPALITPEEVMNMMDFDDKQAILSRMQQDRQMLQQQQQQQGPAQQLTQILTSLGLKVSASLSDPREILQVLELANQQAQQQAQAQAQLNLAHLQNGTQVTQQEGNTGNAPQGPTASPGTGAVSLNNMLAGR